MPYNTTPSIEFDMKGSIVIAEAQNASLVTRSTSFSRQSRQGQALLTQQHHYSPTIHSQDGVRNAYTHAQSSWTTTFVIRTFLQAYLYHTDQNNHVKSVAILARIYTLYFISLACLFYDTHRSLFSHGGESVITIQTFYAHHVLCSQVNRECPNKMSGCN